MFGLLTFIKFHIVRLHLQCSMRMLKSCIFRHLQFFVLKDVRIISHYLCFAVDISIFFHHRIALFFCSASYVIILCDYWCGWSYRRWYSTILAYQFPLLVDRIIFNIWFESFHEFISMTPFYRNLSLIASKKGQLSMSCKPKMWCSAWLKKLPLKFLIKKNATRDFIWVTL